MWCRRAIHARGSPDPSWSTEKLIAATKDKHMLVRSNAIILLSGGRSPSLWRP